jgi:hypothetical protein
MFENMALRKICGHKRDENGAGDHTVRGFKIYALLQVAFEWSNQVK